MQTMIHNLGLLAAAYLTFAAVLVIELAIAAKIDRRRIHARRELTRQI